MPFQSLRFYPDQRLFPVRIDDTSLPPHEAFYSDLKKSNITADEYTYCQKVWHKENMQTVKDFLTWYNNRDVVPFLEALDKIAMFYRERHIDAFKDGISVPGLTMKYLFQAAEDEPCALFDEKNKDLYYTFRANLVGGPSIIFHRYQEKGKTKIRNTDNVCQKIVGFDANALYLWAIMQDMPTGPYLRRREETGFKLEKSRPAIRDDLLFGAIECDIHVYVYDELKPKFAEMCPIFKNTNVSVDDIGEHMKNFVMEGNIMTKPRKSLIGSMFGEKILLPTPLVKWYLQVTRIYQVIEFAPRPCFKAVCNSSEIRPTAKRSPTKKDIVI
ncbi:hypothetical protein HOLleu_00186 [Holothuria leucospilota]|uniref:DNA-directed DNA polymerase n=1 Tax=Holothuria leucospilota TaxID=206669 RepID=A0A9Q1HIJ8_HOLLE|nr:hypothetical protein HOLleu_00186 [Holothuria leucospilota]